MLVMLKLPLPVLFSITVCEELVLPTFWLANVKVEGVRLTVGCVPVPVRATVCVVLE
jgi:hypothetical protein